MQKSLRSDAEAFSSQGGLLLAQRLQYLITVLPEHTPGDNAATTKNNKDDTNNQPSIIALLGLVRHGGRSRRGREILVHCIFSF
jgi:hypothetical protein